MSHLFCELTGLGDSLPGAIDLTQQLYYTASAEGPKTIVTVGGVVSYLLTSSEKAIIRTPYSTAGVIASIRGSCVAMADKIRRGPSQTAET